jgi:FKBP-type peptidyl-prolyl cis-trans isomerase FkpA
MISNCKRMICLGVILLMILSGCATQSPPTSHQESQSEQQLPLTLAQQNLIKSEKWLAENLKQDGVRQTLGGLQYKVLKSTNGCKPDVNAPVTLHYDMKLTSGDQLLDSSYARGSPGVFNLHNMIPGWLEGVALMKTGEVLEFYVPPALAYGERGSGPRNETQSIQMDVTR